MSKYYTFKHNYAKIPFSKENYKKAIISIGKIDPYGIQKTQLFGKAPEPDTELTEIQFFNRGILNIRRKLNGHLGMSGKYSNKMIKLPSEVIEYETEGVYWLKAKLPKDDFSAIVRATYNILYKWNRTYCNTLLQIEEMDDYEMQNICKSIKHKTIAPIQTNLIVRVVRGKTEHITNFAERFRKDISRRN